MSKAYLILADGTIFEGKSIGKAEKSIGEVVFTTGMTGYMETLTDPSYFGQIVTQTFPLIGNYGVMSPDFESKKSWVRGYIVRELCDKPSNFRSEGDLDSFLKAQGIVGLCGIDTRALTKKLREAGVMNGMILSESGKLKTENGMLKVDDSLLEEIRSYKIENAVENVQSLCMQDGGDFKGRSPLGERVADRPTKRRESTLLAGAIRGATWDGSEGETSPIPNKNSKLSTFHFPLSVCLYDFGAKANIQRELEKRSCKVTVLPFNTTANQIIKLAPDGIMLSNGPGDPAENKSVIEEIRKLCEYGKIPIFGICLGHQMLALARGAKTSKLKYGHRGGNHPCKDLENGRVYITSQNHGYAVESASLPPFAKLSFVNENDGTCEGIDYRDIPAFSVQFHPEACSGPHDTNFLFDKFISMMEKSNATE